MCRCRANQGSHSTQQRVRPRAGFLGRQTTCGAAYYASPVDIRLACAARAGQGARMDTRIKLQRAGRAFLARLIELHGRRAGATGAGGRA